MSADIVDENELLQRRAQRENGGPAAVEPDDVWQCNCGSQSFRLYRDGQIECLECKVVSTTIRCFDVTE